MTTYRHHVSGFFAHHEEAESAFSGLVGRGLPRDQIRIFEASATQQIDAANLKPDGKADDGKVLDKVVKEGAIGGAVGAGRGGIAELALVAADISLFVASPLIAPLALLGWGTTLGGFIGAAAGAGNKEEKQFSALMADALAKGQVVLIVETLTEQETSIAREVIEMATASIHNVKVA